MPESIPQIITTLGVEIKPSFFQDIVDAGLKSISVSFYGYSRETYKLIHGVDGFDRAVKNLEKLIEIRNNSSNNFNIILAIEDFIDDIDRINHKKHKEDKQNFIKWLNSKNVNSFHHSKLHNFGNGRNYLESKENLPCSIAWGRMRNYIQISWNLNVIPCCKCFHDDIIFGNLRNQSIEEIFTGKEYKDFIYAHLNNDLDNYPLCKNCEKDLTGNAEEFKILDSWEFNYRIKDPKIFINKFI